MGLLLAVLVPLVGILSTGPQGPPDFSGHWVLTESRGDVPGRPAGAGFTPRASGGGGSLVSAGTLNAELVVTQEAGRLTVERRFGDVVQTIVYALDGSESVSPMGHASRTARSRWDGGALVTEGTQIVKTPQADVSATFRETIWIEDGRLRVETTRDGRTPAQQTYERKK